MAKDNIINKIEEAGLVGRGGACFGVACKWRMVKNNLKGKKIGYIVINAAEGEPGVHKDGYILGHYVEDVINGIYLADQYLGKEKIRKICFFINSEYYKKYGAGIKKVLRTKKYASLGKKVEFYIKSKNLSYISGEESAMLNSMEGKKIEPRLKPPFPGEKGFHDKPTLINNVETFYNVSLVDKGKYNNYRFYTITGAVKHKGVFFLSADLSIREVLERTGNKVPYNFFVQVGGEASGEVLNSSQLDQPVTGAGSIMVYDADKTDEAKLIRYWLRFYQKQSCGHCTACREGTYRLKELVLSDNFDEKLFWDLVDNLEDSSFCALGSSLPIPIRSYFKNILQN